MASVSPRKFEAITNSDVDTLEEIGKIDCSDIEILWLEVAVTGADLTDFDIAARVDSSGSFVTLLTTGSDYTSPEYPLIGCSADPTTLAAASSALLCLNVRGLEMIKLSAAGTSSVVTVYARGA